MEKSYLAHQKVPHRPKNGTVMLELLVTTFLIGSVSIAIFLALTYGYRVTVRVSHERLVNQIAAREMEKIRSMSFDNLTQPYSGPLLSGTERVSLLPSGTAVTNIRLYQNDPTLKEITVTIGWNEQGRSDSTVFTTLVSQEGLSS